jgi:ABC-2 type transport system ATP-binding protein
MSAIIEFDKIAKSFHKKEVLKGVSFKINEGEILGLVSLSGGGKTTLFNILMGLVRPDSGKLSFFGEKSEKSHKKLKKTTGYASQFDLMVEELSIKENCFYFGSLYNMKRKQIKERMKELLPLFDLQNAENILIRNLSGGMKKRANLLIALIHRPQILILDEPTVGLDPIIRSSIWKYINVINKTGTTIIVASHFMEEMEENCSRIVFLKKGRVVAIGTVAQFKNFYKQSIGLNEIFQRVMKDEAL